MPQLTIELDDVEFTWLQAKAKKERGTPVDVDSGKL